MKYCIFPLLLLICNTSFAGVKFYPTKIEMNEKDNNSFFTIKNENNEEKLFKISISGWKQDANHEFVLVEDKDALVYPPILKLTANEEKSVRVFLKKTNFKNYRINILELQNKKQNETGKISYLLQINFGLFMTDPKAPRNTKADFRVGTNNTCNLVLNNYGNNHAQLLGFDYFINNKKMHEDVNHYVLQKSNQTLSLKKEVCQSHHYKLYWNRYEESINN